MVKLTRKRAAAHTIMIDRPTTEAPFHRCTATARPDVPGESLVRFKVQSLVPRISGGFRMLERRFLQPGSDFSGLVRASLVLALMALAGQPSATAQTEEGVSVASSTAVNPAATQEDGPLGLVEEMQAEQLRILNLFLSLPAEKLANARRAIVWLDSLPEEERQRLRREVRAQLQEFRGGSEWPGGHRRGVPPPGVGPGLARGAEERLEGPPEAPRLDRRNRDLLQFLRQLSPEERDRMRSYLFSLGPRERHELRRQMFALTPPERVEFWRRQLAREEAGLNSNGDGTGAPD